MADEKKKLSLGGIDSAAEEKGSGIKTLWQLIKFMVVSGLVTIIQLVLANVLPFIFDKVVTPLPKFLQGIFDPNVVFDPTTEQGQTLLQTSTVSIRTKRLLSNLTHRGTILQFISCL